jgi:hypothetical protein
MAKYIDVNQDDLRIQFTFSEDLTNYTGVMWLYRKDDGIGTASSGTATVSAGTGTSLVYFDVPTGSTIVGSGGTWIFYPIITRSDGRVRSAKAEELMVFVRGVPGVPT